MINAPVLVLNLRAVASTLTDTTLNAHAEAGEPARVHRLEHETDATEPPRRVIVPPRLVVRESSGGGGAQPDSAARQ